MKKVLIISPFFPPVNSADMHRVRQSLPYFKELGWEPVVITVEEAYTESYSMDELLLHTIPQDVAVHKVKALPVKYTRKIGLGSLSMRAYFSMLKKGNELLKKQHFDLVYFSTTAFHVLALGPVWKRKFGVPFIVDIQDPWRNDFYLDKPVSERPPKFRIAYTIDKYLEAKTIPFADGIISVSKAYCNNFMLRYPSVKESQCRVITFGAAVKDIGVMEKYITRSSINFKADKVNLVYVGRGGYDMNFATQIIFKAINIGLKKDKALFSNIHCWFIGTSYATAGTGKKTIQPLAEENGLEAYVTEIPDRMPYFETLYLLKNADVLIMPGSTDIAYTASKIYPYIMLKKKLLAVFNVQSSVVSLLNQLNYGEVIAFDQSKATTDDYAENCYTSIGNLLDPSYKVDLNETLFEPYTALEKTREQVNFFNSTVANFGKPVNAK